MTDQTPLLADGLLGWPGFGPGGSQQWKVQRLYTNDIWYAPRSGFYLIFGGGGGGGGGGGSPNGGGGGGSGATLAGFPLFLPEGAGGVVMLGSGGSGGAWTLAGSNGSPTSLGGELILGGGYGGATSVTGGVSGLISGYAKTRTGNLLVSQGGAGEDGNASKGGVGGSSFVLSTSLTADIAADFIAGLIGVSRGGYGSPSGVSGGAGQSYSSGGGGGFYTSGSGGPGAAGALIIAWVGVL